MIRRILKWILWGAAFILVAGIGAYLTMSVIIKGEARVVVPDLVGKDVVSILETLTQLGLNTKVKGSEHSDQIPKNHVLSQDPPPGSEIKKGRDIRLILSKGPRILPAPNLKKLPLRQARIILQQNGLCLGAISKTFDAGALPETVLAQFPEGGTPWAQEHCIDLLIAMGPRPRTLKMPDLKGRTVSEAISVAQQAGLIPRILETDPGPGLPDDGIVDQEPAPGNPVSEGKEVKLMRPRKNGPGHPSGGSAAQGLKLFRYRAPDGFLKTHLRVEFEGYGLLESGLEVYLDPGEEALFFVPEDVRGDLRVYADDTRVDLQRFESW